MAQPYTRHTNITASALIAPGPGNFYGFVVNSHTSGTIKVWDSLTAAGDIMLNTITLPAGSGLIYTFPFGMDYSLGLFITIGGTADITILWGQLDR